mmetsp:Transcript_80989/g.261697  ORF Transcript_80989/g.261697 Transcript_80989/m.261697 type:complete len:207 (-) Transcript_80989:3879-4499(-)
MPGCGPCTRRGRPMPRPSLRSGCRCPTRRPASHTSATRRPWRLAGSRPRSSCCRSSSSSLKRSRRSSIPTTSWRSWSSRWPPMKAPARALSPTAQPSLQRLSGTPSPRHPSRRHGRRRLCKPRSPRQTSLWCIPRSLSRPTTIRAQKWAAPAAAAAALAATRRFQLQQKRRRQHLRWTVPASRTRRMDFRRRRGTCMERRRSLPTS